MLDSVVVADTSVVEVLDSVLVEGSLLSSSSSSSPSFAEVVRGDCVEIVVEATAGATKVLREAEEVVFSFFLLDEVVVWPPTPSKLFAALSKLSSNPCRL